MALPAAVEYGQVKWQAVSAVADGVDADALPDAVPVTGDVTFTPSGTVLLATGGSPVTIIATAVTYSLDSSGVLRDSEGRNLITLVATNSAGITPTGWTWTCSYRLNNGAARGSFSFDLPSGSVIDLTSVAPVSSSNGVPIIQGPKGDTGGAYTAGQIDNMITARIAELNAADFGALGNDTADDTAALDAAVAAAKAQNRPLYIPAGTYRRTTALDLRGVGAVRGHSSNSTVIKQMTANTPVVQLGHARQRASDLQVTYGTPPTSAHTNANGFEFYHAQKCRFDNLYAYQVGRGFCEPVVTYSSPGAANTLNFFFSNVATNWQVTGYAIDGIALEGGTGNVFNNIYTSNNPTGTKLAPSGRALSIRVMDEAVFNQLNIEWLTASNANPVLFESSGNIVVNGMHIEQVDLSVFGAPFIATSDRVKLQIRGLTMTYCTATNAGTHALVNHFLATSVDINGFFQHDNTMTGTFVLDNVNGASVGASFRGTNMDTSLFTAISANELAAPTQVVREVNGNRYVWQQNGATHITGTAAPTTGTWARGDTVWNTTPSAAGPPGWVCTTAGTPGTWKAMASLAA